MNITVSKWGNSLGIRIPASIVEALKITQGDTIGYEIKNREIILRKEIPTSQMFEEFYGKPMEELTTEDLGPGEEIDWGEDTGAEVF